VFIELGVGNRLRHGVDGNGLRRHAEMLSQCGNYVRREGVNFQEMFRRVS
jgi:hypothetical protein